MTCSGPAHLPRPRGASILAVTAPAATVVTAARVAMTVVFLRAVTVLRAAAASPPAVSVAALLARIASATTSAATVTGPGAPLMVTAR